MNGTFFNSLLLLVALSPLSSSFAQDGTAGQKSGARNAPGTLGERIKDPPKSTASNATSQSRASADATSASAAPDSSDKTPLTDIYRVGAGDVIDIRLLNSTTNRSTLFSVLDGGLIEFPIIGGTVVVGGLTTEEIKALITTELKRRAIQEDAQITVGVRQYASHAVILAGPAANPGTKILRREAVPLYVVLAEAPPRPDAARATIMRNNTPALTIDLGDPAALNVLIRSGDVINFSPRAQEFYYIGGRINYPGQKPFQSDITLLQAVLAAGGLPRSTEGVVEVSREGPDARLITARYNLKEIKAGKVQDPRVRSGDRIEVIH